MLIRPLPFGMGIDDAWRRTAMLTERWMPWAVTSGLLISAGLVCGAAWLATPRSEETRPAAAPCPHVKGQCKIRSVQCRHGIVLTNNGDPNRKELVEADRTCCVVLDSAENLGRAELRLIDETPNRLPRVLSVRPVEITRGTSVITLAVHEIPESLTAVVEWPGGHVEPVSAKVAIAQHLRSADR
jgi:hypothetical protein